MNTALQDSVCLSADDVKAITLVRAIEEIAGDRILTIAQSEAATLNAWKAVTAPQPLSDQAWAEQVLLPRTKRLLEEAGKVDPHYRWIVRTTAPAKAAALLLPVAAVVAFLVDRLPNPERLNLMALPVTGFVLWNWVAFVLLALRAARWGPTKVVDMLVEAIQSAISTLRFVPGFDPWFKEVAVTYFKSWANMGRELWRCRIEGWLHLYAIAIMVGVAASITWAAWHSEFRVGWTSTLCKAECVHTIHTAMLLPIQPLENTIGASPFTAAEIAARHGWAHADPTDGPRWFQLMLALLTITVLAPRLLFLMWSKHRSESLSKRINLDVHHPYFLALRSRPSSLGESSLSLPPPKSRLQEFRG